MLLAELQVELRAKPAKSYPIYLADGLLEQYEQCIPKSLQTKQLLVVSDSNVALLYAKQWVAQLVARGLNAHLISFNAGEEFKNTQTKLALEEEFFRLGADRSSVCVAFGGGVTGDLAGFVAANYMRGIKFMQIPSTLLAMLDSSVGGKVGVNTSFGKNLTGAFWQPEAVIMDLSLLKSLSSEKLFNGLFEAVKIFLTLDKEYFYLVQNNLGAILNLETELLSKVILRAVQLKAQVVEFDETEQHWRMVLNFGHSVAHAIEKLSNYQVLHGYAVALGMLVEAQVANLLGLLDQAELKLIIMLLAQMGVNAEQLRKYSVTELIVIMRVDKKNTQQQIKLVLLQAIGQVKRDGNNCAFIVSETTIMQAFNQLIG